MSRQRRPRHLVWGLPETPPSRKPLRDHLILYGVLAAIVVVFAAVTGGPLVKAIVIAALCFLLASAWTAWRARRQPHGHPHQGER